MSQGTAEASSGEKRVSNKAYEALRKTLKKYLDLSDFREIGSWFNETKRHMDMVEKPKDKERIRRHAIPAAIKQVEEFQANRIPKTDLDDHARRMLRAREFLHGLAKKDEPADQGEDRLSIEEEDSEALALGLDTIRSYLKGIENGSLHWDYSEYDFRRS